MFASSQTDKARAKQVSEAVEDALSKGGAAGIAAAVAKVLGGTVDDTGQGNAMMKGPGGAQKAHEEDVNQVVELVPSLKVLAQDLEQEIRDGKIELRMEPRGLVVSLRQAAFFPSGEDVVAPETYPALEKVASALKQIPSPIRLEGHTDSRPIATSRFPSNWELSAARSIAMLKLFSERFGVPRERLAIVGYADTVAIDSNETEEGRSRNRRVDIVILNQYGREPSAKVQALRKAGKGPEKKH